MEQLIPASCCLSQSRRCSLIWTEWVCIKIKGVNEETCQRSAWLQAHKPYWLQGGCCFTWVSGADTDSPRGFRFELRKDSEAEFPTPLFCSRMCH